MFSKKAFYFFRFKMWKNQKVQECAKIAKPVHICSWKKKQQQCTLSTCTLVDIYDYIMYRFPKSAADKSETIQVFAPMHWILWCADIKTCIILQKWKQNLLYILVHFNTVFVYKTNKSLTRMRRLKLSKCCYKSFDNHTLNNNQV